MDLPIIKSPTLTGQAMTLGVSAPHSDVVDAQLMWRREVEARVRRELELEQAKTLEAVKAEAFEQGYREGLASGHADGVAAGTDAFTKKISLLEQIISKAEQAAEGWMQSVQTVATEVAFDTMGQLLPKQALDPKVLAALVHQVMGALREVDVLAVRLHPAEHQVLKLALKHEGLAALWPARLINRLQEDNSLTSGGVVIDTPRGEYRATLDVMLRKLGQLLEEQRAALSVSEQEQVLRHVLRA